MGTGSRQLLGNPERRLMLTSSSPADRRRGFTLIELMVTLAIAAMALALGAPAFGTWMQNTQIRTVAESIQNGLQVARNEALRRNCPVQFNLNNDTSWTVTAKPSSGDVIVQERTKYEGSSSRISVLVKPNGSTPVATYDGFGRRVDATPFTEVDVLSSASGTKLLRLQVKGTGGQIRMCDPAISVTSDPRYCQ
jgi:type IV fimbrial biogenesis protein FimT